MKSEIFGDTADGDRNLNRAQADYSAERRRGWDVARGRIDRPWCSIGFLPSPVLKRRSRGAMPNFVLANDLRVVMLLRPSRERHPTQHNRHVVSYPVAVATPWIDSDGTTRVGGRLENLVCFHNYALPPYRDSYASQTCTNMYGELTCFQRNGRHTEPEAFVTSRDAHYFYLCVGKDEEGKPMCQYRFALGDIFDFEANAFKIEITGERLVSPGDVLATLPRPIPFERGEYGHDGQPKREWRVFGAVSASKHDAVIPILNRALKQQNDRVFEPTSELPLFHEAKAPRFMVVLTQADVENLRAVPGFTETPWLQTRIMEAIGTGRNLFYIRSEHDAKFVEVAPSATQPHLKEIRFDNDQTQLIPECAITALEPGQQVSFGQPIGDICERHNFQSWSEVEAVIGTHRDYYLVPKFLSESVIKPGQSGWSGPGYLVDVRIAQPIMKPGMQLVVDFRDSKSLCEGADHCLLPPFYQDELVDQVVNGCEYSMFLPRTREEWKSGSGRRAVTAAV